MQRIHHILETRHTVVVKIGTNILADKTNGINTRQIEAIAHNVAMLSSFGHRVALVTSGAIGAGVAALKLHVRPKTIPEKQATASIGQPLLMEAYENAFRKHSRIIAQILLTKDDFTNRTRYVNAKNTFGVLLRKGVIPIVNENDTVAVDEIKLGDNDNLSAMVANMIGADLLIILSDIDGLFSDDPTKNPNAVLIPVVETITPQIERLAKSSRTELSTGGMATKIQAAKRCVSSGIAMIIANGGNPNVLGEIFSGTSSGTIFLPATKGMTLKKKWIGFVSHAMGSIVIDDGATTALLHGNKSLLPSGITEVNGDFRANDTISVRDMRGNEVARGVTAYSSVDLDQIKGKKTNAIGKILGSKSSGAAIHKNNLVVIGEQ